jgi:hypothetical protein
MTISPAAQWQQPQTSEHAWPQMGGGPHPTRLQSISSWASLDPPSGIDEGAGS